MKSLTEKANEVAKKFDEGQEIFRRSSVSILLARIQSLEIDAKQRTQEESDPKKDANFQNQLKILFREK